MQTLFDRRGCVIVFVGRMRPTVRSLISVPAGLMHMQLLPFMLWSTAGSLLWTAGLATAGWVLGNRFARVEQVLGPLSIAVIAGGALFYLHRVITWRPASGEL